MKLVAERKLFVKVRPEHKEGSSLRSELLLLEYRSSMALITPTARRKEIPSAPVPPLTDWLRGHFAQ